MTSPAIAKPRGVLKIRRGGEKKKGFPGNRIRGVLKIPTNEKIKPKAHNPQPSPGTQLKIKPNKARIKPAVPSPFVLLRSC